MSAWHLFARTPARESGTLRFRQNQGAAHRGHFAKRDAGDLAEYVAKVRLVSEDIAAGEAQRLVRLPAPVFGEQKEAQETLVKIT